MPVDILSALGAVFPVYKIVYSISVIRIIGKKRAILGTVGVLSRISLTSKGFWSRFLARTTLFSSSIVTSG